NPGRVLQRELCGHTTARWTTPTRFFERITLPTGKSGSDFHLQFVDFGLRLFLAKGQGFLIKFDCLSQGFTLFAWRELRTISGLLYGCGARIVGISLSHL